MSPGTGSLLLLLLSLAGVTAFIKPTKDLSEDKEAYASSDTWKKPGKCPADVDFSFDGSTAEVKCVKDRDCEGKRKCCFYGGRRQCLLPLDVKTNACPYFSQTKCMVIKPGPSQCHSDKQCPGTDRCCNYGCNFRCKATVKKDKEGKCKFYETFAPCFSIKEECQGDANCPDKQKCCNVVCTMKCDDPEESEQ